MVVGPVTFPPATNEIFTQMGREPGIVDLSACGYVLRPFDGRGLKKQLRRIAAIRVRRALTSASQT